MDLCLQHSIPKLASRERITLPPTPWPDVMTSIVVRVGFCLAAFFSTGKLMADAPSPATKEEITAPAYNWSLRSFTKEGFPQMFSGGTEARRIDAHRLDVVDLNLRVFSGDASARVEAILLSPAATFLPDAKIARGDKSVRFISFYASSGPRPGEQVEASGIHWIYQHDQKKISLDGSVHVTFDAELKNLLQ